jgi:predicted AlkP superfamily phosphohydrolase/phosphomutase
MEHFNEIRTEFLADVGDVNKFVEKQIPEINDLLKKSNAGALMAGKPVEIPASLR